MGCCYWFVTGLKSLYQGLNYSDDKISRGTGVFVLGTLWLIVYDFILVRKGFVKSNKL